MSDIMEATKLSNSNLYVHFKNKEALVGEVVDMLIDVMNPSVAGGCPMINFGMEADDTNPVVNNHIHERIEASQRVISDVIRQGIRAGEFKSGCDDKEFAIIMFAMIEGAIIIGRVARSNEKTRVVSRRLKQMIMEQVQGA